MGNLRSVALLKRKESRERRLSGTLNRTWCCGQDVACCRTAPQPSTPYPDSMMIEPFRPTLMLLCLSDKNIKRLLALLNFFKLWASFLQYDDLGPYHSLIFHSHIEANARSLVPCINSVVKNGALSLKGRWKYKWTPKFRRHMLPQFPW